MKILYFFIGTEAELMKMFRVIQEAKARGYECRVISNGQNDIKGSYYLTLVGGKIDIDLTQYMAVQKNASNYLGWFLRTERLGIKVMKAEKKKNKDILMIVHGDTLSTLMGARIAHKCGIEYMHVESGLRSFNWFSPFPEEIDRYFSSKHSVINFCQKEEAAEYAGKTFKGKAVNTEYNTGIEILFNALKEIEGNNIPSPEEEKYFLVAVHRQENLMNETFMKEIFERILDLSRDMKCIFIYHVQTENALKKFGLWEKINHSENIKIIPRQDYITFINYVIHSEFVMADGCGNQQEFYYLGQPYLIMRTEVEENSEGLGWNAVCFKGDYKVVDDFVSHYKEYKKERIVPRVLPSNIIMDAIDEYCDRAKKIRRNKS